ncbi:MAG: PAS domain S-box protein, partial [Deltaproteobacteria bacterium]|nr:PAS domain S-box protein [Deltaproteobacteria bacterium]
MNLFSLLSLLSFTVYIYLGLYAFKLDSRSALNRIFLVLCLDLAWCAFSYAFVYPAPDKEVLWFWFKLSAIGWCLLGGIALHLALVLTQKEKLLKNWWIYPVLYLPGLVILFNAWKGVVTAKDFIRTPLGWIEVGAPDSIWWWVHTINYSTCLLVGILLIYRWGKSSHNPIHKKQAGIIIYTVILSFVIGTLINIVFPVFQLQVLPAIAPVIILIWAYGIWRAVIKYRLMVLTPAIATEEIISRMKDILILTNPDGKIIKINRQAEKVLGYQEEEVLRQPIGMICRDEEVVQEVILRITNNRFSLPDREVEYQTKNGELIPVKISISIMKDKLGEAMGVVIIAEDKRTTLRLRDEITVRRRAEDALLKAHADLEVRIQNRTDELFRANEALQGEMAEREEMEKLFRILFMQSPIGTYIAQQEKIKLANPEFANVTGYLEKELMTIPSLSLVHSEDREEVKRNAVQMLKGERHHPYEFRIMTHDGRIRWILETVTSIRYQGLPATLASFMDITNRKESEEM